MDTKSEARKQADRAAQELVDNLNRNLALKDRADRIAQGLAGPHWLGSPAQTIARDLCFRHADATDDELAAMVAAELSHLNPTG